jgi:hypothetical protein
MQRSPAEWRDDRRLFNRRDRRPQATRNDRPAIKSAKRIVDSHVVALWQFMARPKQMFKK